MDMDPNCVVCGEKLWDSLATKSYSIEVTPSDLYSRVRHQVLFDLWFQGSSHVELESILCRSCGFLCYRPRPETEDIDRKYAYIAEHEEASKEFSQIKASDQPRARELYQQLHTNLPASSCSILDYGGGNGRLLGALMKMGHKCWTLDLVDQTLPGIGYAGSQIADLSSHPPFDALVCSHVVEHLADPLDTLRKLIPHIKDNGIVYIEVPAEIWNRPPPSIDPVTHINFFTTQSLRTLMEKSGLQVVSCKYQAFTRPNGLTGLAVKAVGKTSAIPTERTVTLAGPKPTYKLLKPSTYDKVRRLLQHPRLLKNLFQ
ncbi:MAG: class I SAM-dependent methyltransferase [Halioglobus sp.]|nr:class I SAM-dependent methyltransferase [Halioglobus sp.]